MATYDEFVKIEIRAGTVVRTEAFPEARKPAVKMWIDFGKLLPASVVLSRARRRKRRIVRRYCEILPETTQGGEGRHPPPPASVLVGLLHATANMSGYHNDILDAYYRTYAFTLCLWYSGIYRPAKISYILPP